MRASIVLVVFPGDDAQFKARVDRTGPTLSLDGDVHISWSGADGAERAIATLRRLADEIEAGQ